MEQEDIAHWLDALRDGAYWQAAIFLLVVLVAAPILAVLLVFEAFDLGYELQLVPAPFLILSIAVNALTFILAIVLLNWMCEVARRHAARVLTDGGLLYAAIEHEPAEALRSLRRRTIPGTRLANPGASLSFRRRLADLIATYNTCAVAIRQRPLPPLLSGIRQTALGTLTVLSAAVLTTGIMWLNEVLPDATGTLGVYFLSLAIAPAIATLTVVMAERTGVAAALADVLGADATDAPALPTYRRCSVSGRC